MLLSGLFAVAPTACSMVPTFGTAASGRCTLQVLHLTDDGDRVELDAPYTVHLSSSSGTAAVGYAGEGWRDVEVWMKRPDNSLYESRWAGSSFVDAREATTEPDQAGTWRVRFEDRTTDCVQEFPLEVLPARRG